MTTLTLEAVRELRDGCEGVTPGPWIRSGVRKKLGAYNCLMVGPDRFRIIAVPIGRDSEHARAFIDAGYIARCFPEFIQALAQGWIEMRAALERIAAFDDALANDRLGSTGSYGAFDEPVSVETARAALKGQPS